MMTFLASLGGLYFVGSIVVIFGIRNAPEGYEDETGFHVVWCNNDPEVADVACVWDLGSAHPAM